MSFREECGICGRVLRAYRLRKCSRCKRLFCRDCMVPDVATGNPLEPLCLHCARRVVAPRSVSKYAGLAAHLKFRGSFTKLVTLSLARIDGLIGSNLPMSAYKDVGWWANSPSSAHARSWLDSGWDVQEVNLREGLVVFKKVRETRIKRKRRKGETNKPFTPVPVRPIKPRAPSKTKVSKLYARIKNLERQRSAPKGSARSPYEKRLFKSSEKPR